MHKKVFRKIAFFLCGMLAFSNLGQPIMPVNAASYVKNEVTSLYETSYTLDELTNTNNGYGVTISSKADGTTVLTYSQKYGETRYQIPKEVLEAGLNAIDVELSSISTIGLKVCDSACTQIMDYYWTKHIDIVDTEHTPEGKEIPEEKKGDVAVIALMCATDVAEGETHEATIGNIVFHTTNPVEGVKEKEQPQTKDIVYNSADMSFKERWSGSPVTGNTLTFSKQYEEYYFTLPEELNMEYCQNIRIVTSNQGGKMAVKTITAEGTDEPYYNITEKTEYNIVPTKALVINRFSFMSDASEPFKATIESVTFTMLEQEKGEDDKIVYDSSNIKLQGRWNGTAVTGNTLTFTKQYDEYCFALSETLNMKYCKNIHIVTSNQQGKIAVKTLTSGDATEDFYDISGNIEDGKTVYDIVPTKPLVIDRFVIMGMEETEKCPYNTTIESVTFTMVEPGDEEEIEDDGPVVTGKVVYDNNNIQFKERWGNTPVEGMTLTFDKQWNEYVFDLEPILNLKTCEEIIVKLSNQGGVLAFKVYSDEGANNDYYGKEGSNQYSLAPPPVKAAKFAVMATGDPATTVYPYSVTIESVTFDMGDGQEACIEEDIPNWKDSLVEDLGAGTIAGTAATLSEMEDETLMELVTKHFNAVTLGNELKLDAMLGYKKSCNEDQTETVTFNGQQLQVPKLDHSRADTMLDKILAWNEEHPETPLKVRGHVLVWHSQAPECFFKENYNVDAAFVSKEVMDLRLEWYIKTMLEYYTGENSKYKDLFYGWDVVNEAINDGTNTYRGADESSWAKVYGDKSNEYIIKAFQFANQYAPKSLELYYNDYNDCVPGKRDGIVKLLQAVKAAEGTRIDGMGMQGHYNMESPTAKQFEDAVRAYAAVVGKVQLTELDFKASSKYDGTDATKAEEYTKQAYRYKMFYDVAKKLDAEEGIDFSGITVWGVVDKYSWLQSQSNVGGGASGNQVQCPLLFDDDYKAKPSYWAFVDPTKLEPSTQSMTIIEAGEAGFDNAKTYSFSGGDTVVTFLPVWSDKTVKVLVKVKDATVDETDSVTLFIDEANSKADGITPKKVTVKRSEGKAVANGYQAELSLDLASAFVSKKIGFDLRVVDGDASLSFNDFKNTQDGSSKYYAEASLKPYATVNKGTAKVDGVKEDIWNTDGVKIPLTINLGSNVKADVTALWDESYLYILAEVQDSVLNKDSANAYEQDSLEVFIDENNHKSESYEEDDKQYRINYLNEQSFNGVKCKAENVVSAAKETEGGYLIEAAFKWTDITPENGTEIGLEFQINDAGENGKRSGTLSWYDETGMGWSAPGVYGTVKLVAAEHKHQMKKLEGKAATCTEDGLTVAYECTDCKELFADEKGEKSITAADRVINKLGHSYETTLKAATCTADGEKVTICKNCKDTTKETIKAVGHTYQNGVCSVCQTKDPEYKPETEVEVVTKPETQQVANAVKDEMVNTVSASIKAVKAKLEASGEAVSTDKLVAAVKEALIESKSQVVDAVSEKTLEKVVLAAVENKEISVSVVARPVSAETVKEAAKQDVDKIEKMIAKNEAVAQYLELSVLIQAKDAEGKVETLGTIDEPKKEFTFTLSVPKNLQKEGRVFYVIRVHNGEAEKLAVVDNKDGTISFKTDKFSTYALAYTDEESAGGDNSSGGSGTTEEATSTQNTTSVKVAPQTGDANKVAEWATIFAAGLGAMLFILKKKRQM